MDEKKPFKVILPIAFGGIKDPGEIVYMTQAEAENIGIGKRLEAVDEVTQAEDTETNTGEYVEDEPKEEVKTEPEASTETENTESGTESETSNAETGDQQPGATE